MVNDLKNPLEGRGLGEMSIIGRSPVIIHGRVGEEEYKLTWKMDDPKGIARAKRAFNQYVNKGWLAVGEQSGEKRQIFSFNPSLEKIILAPLVMGG